MAQNNNGQQSCTELLVLMQQAKRLTQQEPVNQLELERLVHTLLQAGALHVPPTSLVALPSGGVKAEWCSEKRNIELSCESGKLFATATDEDGRQLLWLSALDLTGDAIIPDEFWAQLRGCLGDYAQQREGAAA